MKRRTDHFYGIELELNYVIGREINRLRSEAVYLEEGDVVWGYLLALYLYDVALVAKERKQPPETIAFCSDPDRWRRRLHEFTYVDYTPEAYDKALAILMACGVVRTTQHDAACQGFWLRIDYQHLDRLYARTAWPEPAKPEEADEDELVRGLSQSEWVDRRRSPEIDRQIEEQRRQIAHLFGSPFEDDPEESEAGDDPL